MIILYENYARGNQMQHLVFTKNFITSNND